MPAAERQVISRLRQEPPTDELARDLAIDILTWLAEDNKLIGRFLELTGFEANAIRPLIDDKMLHVALTGFLMGYEPTMLAFCSATNTRMEWVHACHYHLAGADTDAWL
jgi:hypothetical protein